MSDHEACDPPIEADLAEKGLKADVRNALQNVAQGELLPPSKQDLLFGVLVGDAAPDEVWDAHIAALAKKFAKGGRLNAEEMQRIAHLLPADLAPFSRRLTRDLYQHSYADYSTIYGKSARTVKWWVGQGKKATDGPDLPPLDDPVQMPVWWKRVMTQKCPAGVEAAARKAAGSPQSTTTAPPSKPSNGSSAPPSPPASAAYTARIEVATGDDSLNQLKEQLARARLLLLEAQNELPPDVGKIETREKKWRELRDEVDKAEEASFKLRSKMGKLASLDDIAARLTPMLVTCHDSLRSLIQRIRPRLAASQAAEEQDALWQEALDECFTELIGNGFMPRFTLAAAA